MATSKITKGSGFGACLNYTSGKEGAREISTGGLYSHDVAGRASEMEAVAASNSRTTKPVFHASISLPPGESLSDEKWREVGESYLKRMGFDPANNQFLITRHTDQAHDHIHIVANRVGLDGKTVSDSKERWRSREALNEIEKEHGLQRISDRSRDRSTGKLADMKARVTDAAKNSKTPDEFRQNLSQHNIKLIEHRQSTGRLAGVSFEDTSDKGRLWKGSAIGKEYSGKGLQKAGLVESSPARTQQVRQPARQPAKLVGAAKASAGKIAGVAGLPALPKIPTTPMGALQAAAGVVKKISKGIER